MARDNYHEQKMDKLELVGGEWPRKDIVVVDKEADKYFNVRNGDPVYLKINNNKRLVKVGGAVANSMIEPLSIGGDLNFYTTREHFTELIGEQNFNMVMANSPVYDEIPVRQTADRINTQLEKQNFDTGGALPKKSRTLNPATHFAQAEVDGPMLIMVLLGAGAVILGLFLNYNTINAIIAEQVHQIGIMKAIGASRRQILWIYLSLVLTYGLLALVISLPLAALGAYFLKIPIVAIFSIDPGPFTVDPLALTIQAVIDLLSPLLAAVIPLSGGLAYHLREAVSTYGLSAPGGLLDRLLAKIRRIPRLVLLAMGNTFRNKRRILLTLLTLTTGGLMFMVVVSVMNSAAYTFSTGLTSIHTYQVTLRFKEPQRLPLIERMTLAQPGVATVEMWSVADGRVRPAQQADMGEDDQVATLFGMPASTQMYAPHLQDGRWFTPGETNVVVLNVKLAEQIGVGVGDWITVYHGPRWESSWRVIGLLADPPMAYSAYMPYATLSEKLKNANKANTVWVKTTQRDNESIARLAQTLRSVYEQHKIDLTAKSTFRGETLATVTTEARATYEIIIVLLGIMAVLMAAVGSVGLSGVLSLSVLERRREIGVMRAIGASSGKIAWLFIGEGLMVGLLSWLLAVPLSLPLANSFTQQLGAVMQVSMTPHYAPLGPVYWLVIVVILAVAASWFPARSATRVSVRESLAYQ